MKGGEIQRIQNELRKKGQGHCFIDVKQKEVTGTSAGRRNKRDEEGGEEVVILKNKERKGPGAKIRKNFLDLTCACSKSHDQMTGYPDILK
jgi:hypothetical protein